MNILVVEDEENKAKRILSFLHTTMEDNIVDMAKSYMSALIKLANNKYDYIILDMSLPLNDDNYVQEDFNTFAGLEILDELKRKQREERVVVFTAFDILGENEKRISLPELDERMKMKYSENYIGCVHYNALSLEWQAEIINKIEKG
ncbi:MAG TPA: response regulator [Ruminococcus sp.]|nr:response regulator [Ruminococcus sp.]